MSEEKFSPEQSLQLIQSMIDKAKQDISENWFYFLLWGWITFTAIIGQFLLKVVFQYQHHYYVWFLTFVGAAASIYHGIKTERKNRVKTYVSENMSYLWTGMGLAFFIMCLLFFKLGWLNAFPFFMLMYGLGTFVSGRILHFRALVAGGIISWVLGGIAIWFSFDYQMIFAAAAILFSYIIPGHILRSHFNRKTALS